MTDPSTVAHHRYATVRPGAFVALGAGTDVDTALDDAVAAAHDEFGHGGAIRSIADADPSTVTVLDATATSVEFATVRALRELAGPTFGQDPAGEDLSSAGLRDGVVYALATTKDAGYRRRRLTVRVDDPAADLPVDDTGGPVDRLSVTFAEYVRKLLADNGVVLQPGEDIEAVEVRSLRRRYKPVVTVNDGKSAFRWVATIAETGARIAEGATAGEARRAAVAAARAGSAGDLQQYTIEVEKIVRVGDWQPKIVVRRDRVAQKATLRIVVAELKNPDKVRHSGWLFFGTAAADATVVGADTTTVDSPAPAVAGEDSTGAGAAEVTDLPPRPPAELPLAA